MGDDRVHVTTLTEDLGCGCVSFIAWLLFISLIIGWVLYLFD